MKLEELWAQYQSYTKDLTNNSRKLAFASAAICWFFKTPKVTFPKFILFSLLSVVFFFVFDILQNLVASIKLRNWTRKQEEKHWQESGTIDIEVNKDWSLDKPVYKFFLAKTGFLFLSFSFLLCEFIKRLFH